MSPKDCGQPPRPTVPCPGWAGPAVPTWSWDTPSWRTHASFFACANLPTWKARLRLFGRQARGGRDAGPQGHRFLQPQVVVPTSDMRMVGHAAHTRPHVSGEGHVSSKPEVGPSPHHSTHGFLRRTFRFKPLQHVQQPSTAVRQAHAHMHVPLCGGSATASWSTIQAPPGCNRCR